MKNISYTPNFPLPIDVSNVSSTSTAVDGIGGYHRTTLTRRKINALVRNKFPNQISANTRKTLYGINSTTVYGELHKNGFGKSKT